MRKKSGNIFTKFEENFGESLNLVNKSSDKTFTKFGETKYCDNLFTNFGVILIKFLVIFLVRKRAETFSPNVVKILENHQFW